jgi:hypothetical protein
MLGRITGGFYQDGISAVKDSKTLEQQSWERGRPGRFVAGL